MWNSCPQLPQFAVREKSCGKSKGKVDENSTFLGGTTDTGSLSEGCESESHYWQHDQNSGFMRKRKRKSTGPTTRYIPTYSVMLLFLTLEFDQDWALSIVTSGSAVLQAAAARVLVVLCKR